MKCSKSGCGGTMYRFHPKHLVAAWYRTDTNVSLELGEPAWKQVGLMCDACGCMEFYAQDPQEALAKGREFFESTEPEPEARG